MEICINLWLWLLIMSVLVIVIYGINLKLGTEIRKTYFSKLNDEHAHKFFMKVGIGNCDVCRIVKKETYIWNKLKNTEYYLEYYDYEYNVYF